MSLTANQIRCLLAILALTRMDEEVASKNVAKLLGVTKPTVHKALDILVSKGLLVKEHYGSARLSERGWPWLSSSRRARSDSCCCLVRPSAFPWMRAALRPPC